MGEADHTKEEMEIDVRTEEEKREDAVGFWLFCCTPIFYSVGGEGGWKASGFEDVISFLKLQWISKFVRSYVTTSRF